MLAGYDCLLLIWRSELRTPEINPYELVIANFARTQDHTAVWKGSWRGVVSQQSEAMEKTLMV